MKKLVRKPLGDIVGYQYTKENLSEILQCGYFYEKDVSIEVEVDTLRIILRENRKNDFAIATIRVESWLVWDQNEWLLLDAETFHRTYDVKEEQ